MTKLEDIDIADYVPRNLSKNYYIWVQDAKKNIKDKVIVILLLFVAEIRLAMFHWFCSYISFCIGCRLLSLCLTFFSDCYQPLYKRLQICLPVVFLYICLFLIRCRCFC